GDLVAHAGVAVLDVVALRIAGTPQLVQLAGHRPGGAHDDVARSGDLVDRTDDLALRGQRAVPARVRAGHGLVPRAGEPGRLVAVGGLRGPAVERRGEGLDARPGVGDQGDPVELAGIEPGHVEVDDPRLAEQRPGRGGEVAVPGADADDHV